MSIVHPADVVISTPGNLKARTSAGFISRVRRFAGFGSSYKVVRELSDVNDDGVCCLGIQCPKDVETTVRASDGTVVLSVSSSETHTIHSQLAPGVYTAVFTEV